MSGFEDAAGERQDIAAEPEKPSRLSLDGHVLLAAAANFAHKAPEDEETDWRGLSRFSPELFLEADYAFSKKWKAVAGANFFYDTAYA